MDIILVPYKGPPYRATSADDAANIFTLYVDKIQNDGIEKGQRREVVAFHPEIRYSENTGRYEIAGFYTVKIVTLELPRGLGEGPW